MPTVRPFSFGGLPQLSRQQVAVQESVANWLSSRPLFPSFEKELSDALAAYLHEPLRISAPDLAVVSGSDLNKLLPEIGCLAVIGAAPGEQKIIVELDAGLATMAIDRLLGGRGDVGRLQRPLTDIEQGLLSFVLLVVIDKLQDQWTRGAQLTLTLDQLAGSPSDIEHLLGDDVSYHLLGYRLAVGSQMGYARVLLPEQLVTSSFSTPPQQASATPLDRARFESRLRSIGTAITWGRVEVASLDLSSDELAGLEPGDIVLLEQHTLKLSADGLAGEAFVKIGAGQNGGLRCRLFYEGDNTRLEITEIVTQEQPLESVMVDSDGDNPQPEQQPDAPDDSEAGAADGYNLAETEALLRDVDAPVVVELGRIKLNTSQVARLRTGQTLRLGRTSKEPVNLVVNGKLLARGELVEVEGELGVRLLQLAGD